MPTSTEEIDIAKLLINGRQGRAFRDFDRDMKEWLKAQYMHMSKYFYTGTRKKVAQRQKNRRKRYADEIYNLLDKRGSRSKSRWSVPEECSARMIIEWFSEQQDIVYQHMKTLCAGIALKKVESAYSTGNFEDIRIILLAKCGGGMRIDLEEREAFFEPGGMVVGGAPFMPENENMINKLEQLIDEWEALTADCPDHITDYELSKESKMVRIIKKRRQSPGCGCNRS